MPTLKQFAFDEWLKWFDCQSSSCDGVIGLELLPKSAISFLHWIWIQVSKLKEKIATEKGDEYAIENQKLIYAGIVTVDFALITKQ